MRRVIAIVSGVMAALLALSGVCYAGNPTQDRFVVRDQSTRFGQGLSDARHGEDLAWGEDGFLKSYYYLYTSTGDRYWLDKIIDHADRMIGNAYDHNGDGSKGWPDLKQVHQQLTNRVFTVETAPDGAANLISNAGFEVGTTIPADWQQVGPSGSTLRSTDPGDVFAGDAGALVRSDGTNQSMLIQQISYTPGTRYVVEAFAGIDEGATQGIIEIYNATTSSVLASTMVKHAGFERYSFSFAAPSSGTLQVRLRLNKYIHNGWEARFDDVSVRALAPTADSAAACPDGVGGSPPLVCTDAVGWTRDNTSLAYAHRTNDPAATDGKAWVMQLLGGGPTAPRVSQELLNYAPLSEYGFSVALRGSGGLRVIDTTTNTVLVEEQFSASTTFTRRYVYFDTPAAGHDLRAEIYLTDNTSSGRASAHDVWMGQLWEMQLQEGNAYTPILWFVNAVYDDPSLVSYKSKADQYLEFAAQNLVHKWDPYWHQISGVDGQNNGTGVYTLPGGFSNINSPGRSVPPNQYLSYARILYLLHQATDGDPAYASERPYYLSRANDLNRLFRAHLRVHPKDPDAVIWNYSDYYGPWDDARYTAPTNEDAGHAMLTMAGVMEAYQYGQVWTREDMQKLVNTWTEVMFDGNFTTPRFSLNNDGINLTDAGASGIGAYVKFAEIDQKSFLIADARERAYGGLAAQYSQLYRNKTINTQFEWQLLTELELPAYWSSLSSTGTTERVMNAGQIGRWALQIQADGTSLAGVEQQLPNYDPGAPYVLQLRGQPTSGVTKAELFDYTTSTSLGEVAFTGTGWQDTVVHLTTMPTEAGHDVRVKVYSTGSAVIDEVRAFPILSRSQAPNGDFETSVRNIPARPEHWTLGSGTTWDNATLDPSTYLRGARSLKLTTLADSQPAQVLYNWRGYQPGTSYTIAAFGKANASGGTITVTDLDTGQQLANLEFTSSSWTAQTEEMVTPLAYNHTLQISIQNTNAAIGEPGQFWVDDLGVFRTDDPIL